jgi:hypothetical protein
VFDPSYEGLALGEGDDQYWVALENYYMEESAEGTASVSYFSDATMPLMDAAKIQNRLLGELKSYVRRFNELFAEPKRIAEALARRDRAFMKPRP